MAAISSGVGFWFMGALLRFAAKCQARCHRIAMKYAALRGDGMALWRKLPCRSNRPARLYVGLFHSFQSRRSPVRPNRECMPSDQAFYSVAGGD